MRQGRGSSALRFRAGERQRVERVLVPRATARAGAGRQQVVPPAYQDYLGRLHALGGGFAREPERGRLPELVLGILADPLDPLPPAIVPICAIDVVAPRNPDRQLGPVGRVDPRDHVDREAAGVRREDAPVLVERGHGDVRPDDLQRLPLHLRRRQIPDDDAEDGEENEDADRKTTGTCRLETLLHSNFLYSRPQKPAKTRGGHGPPLVAVRGYSRLGNLTLPAAYQEDTADEHRGCSEEGHPHRESGERQVAARRSRGGAAGRTTRRAAGGRAGDATRTGRAAGRAARARAGGAGRLARRFAGRAAARTGRLASRAGRLASRAG